MEDGRKTLPVLAGPGEVYNPASYGVNRGESQMGLTSPSHLIILLVILLLLFGAKKIPELARGLGAGDAGVQAGRKRQGRGRGLRRHLAQRRERVEDAGAGRGSHGHRRSRLGAGSHIPGIEPSPASCRGGFLCARRME